MNTDLSASLNAFTNLYLVCMKIGEARRAERRLMKGSRSQAYLGVTFITTIEHKTQAKDY